MQARRAVRIPVLLRDRTGAEPEPLQRRSALQDGVRQRSRVAFPAHDPDTANGAPVSVTPALSRDDILAAFVRTGYDLQNHPAHIIRRAHQRATAAFQDVLAGDNLTPTQYAAMAVLLQHGVVSQNHLGRLTAMDPSTISLVVRTLSKRGLITRHPSDRDQRLSLVTLTDAGARYALERLTESMNVARRLLDPLSAAEQVTLLTLLRRIAGLDEEAS